MSFESISLGDKNDLWLRDQIESIGDYANKSEFVNEFIQQVRKAEELTSEELCECAEQSPQEMLNEFKLLLFQVHTFPFN